MTVVKFLLARIAEDEHFGTHDRHLLRWWTAECKARRRIVEDFESLDEVYGFAPDPVTQGRRYQAYGAVAHLASVYADHPDYRDEWRP